MFRLQSKTAWPLLVLAAHLNSCLCYSVHNYAPEHEEYKKSSDYSFSYGVKDLHTGDIKHQWEKKTGDSVKGHYSLVEPDGSIRSVDYVADKHRGFNAVVKHSSPSLHPAADSKAPSSHSEVLLKPQTVTEDYQYKLPNAAVQLFQRTTPHHLSEQDNAEDPPQYQYQPEYQQTAQNYDSPDHFQQSQEAEGAGVPETYLFLPQEEATDERASDSQTSGVSAKSEYDALVRHAAKPDGMQVLPENQPPRQQYHLIQQHYLKDEQEDEETSQTNNYQRASPAPLSVEYTYPVQHQTKLPTVPLELNLSHPSVHAGVDETYLNPVSIDLSKLSDHKYSKYQIVTNQPPVVQSAHHQHRPSELTQQELEQYLKSYTGANEAANAISQPNLETGFRPVTSAPIVTTAQTFAGYHAGNRGPGTFKSNKKPKITPGLRHYATKGANGGGKNAVRFQQQIHQVHRSRPYKGSSLTHQVPKEESRTRLEQQQVDLDQLIHSNKYITYKHVAYQH